MMVSNECLERGIFAQGIRFPSVPEGTARLRFTLMSDHLEEDLEKAVSVLKDVLEMTGLREQAHSDKVQART